MMEHFLLFHVRAAVLMALLAGMYGFVLRKLPALNAHRVYLLVCAFGPFAAVGLSLLNLPIAQESRIALLPPVLISGQSPGTGGEKFIGMEAIGWVIYFSGVILRLVRMGYSALRVRRMVQSSPEVAVMDGFRILDTGPAGTIGSFGKTIFIKTGLPEKDAAFLIAHEKAHGHYRHLTDRLLIELLMVVCWFHPVLYLIRHWMKEVHEAQADRAALRHGTLQAYLTLVLRLSLPDPGGLTHAFSRVHFNYRIHMMKQTRFSFRARMTYALSTTLAVCAFGLIAISQNPLQAQVVVKSDSATVIKNKQAAPPLVTMEGLDEAPKPNNMLEVQRMIGYPEAARDGGIDGTVNLKVHISAEGAYQRHEVLGNPPEVLRDAVEQYAPQLVFSPGKKGSQAVDCWAIIPFKFKLLK